MSNVWQVSDDGGQVVIATASGGTEIMDGMGVTDCSLATRQDAAEFRPMEARSPNRWRGATEYRVTLNRGLEDTRQSGVTEQTILDIMTAERLWVTYRDANGTILFQGWATWEQLGDSQRNLDAAMQSMSLINDGDPSAPAAAADPATWPYAKA